MIIGDDWLAAGALVALVLLFWVLIGFVVWLKATIEAANTLTDAAGRQSSSGASILTDDVWRKIPDRKLVDFRKALQESENTSQEDLRARLSKIPTHVIEKDAT